ncbi:hypothetical protein IW262DRAFT_1453287 [Armillaria fumosa]|nr:hypothetical protein IW262DRAFT_1453287 [Armillaria fumosa]
MANTDGLNVLYYPIRLTCQTLVYGMYAILMPICSYVMLRRGLRGKSRILLFCMLVFMFSLSTAYWILSLYHIVLLITTSSVHGLPLDNIASTYGMQQGIIDTGSHELQLRRRKITTAERIFTLLVESGIIYCFSGLTVLVTSLIRLPYGTLGDVYTPVNIQFAGIYPTIVLLLVSRQDALNETVIFTFQDKSNPQERAQDVSNLDTIEFGDNPRANSSFGETETFEDATRNASMVSHRSQA